MKNMLTGLLAGLINGLLGSGGGVIIVPALEFIHHVRAHKAHATAIAIILPITLLSSAIYFFNGSVPWDATLKVGTGAILGGLIGALILNRFKSTTLRKIFGIVMIATAIRMFM